jgi:hypothetical protein
VKPIADSRFGSRRITDELKDCITILRSELDELGLLAEYRQDDGSLVAWHPEDDNNLAAVLCRASFKDDQPSEPAYLNRVVFPM